MRKLEIQTFKALRHFRLILKTAVLFYTRTSPPQGPKKRTIQKTDYILISSQDLGRRNATFCAGNLTQILR